MRTVLVIAALLPACGGAVEVTNANNFSFEGEMTVAEVEVQPETHLKFDWSAVTTDLRERPFDGSVDEIALVRPFDEMTVFLDEAIHGLFAQEDMLYTALASPEGGATSIETAEMGILALGFDLTQLADGNTLLASLNDYPEGRTDLLMSKIIKPTAGSTNTVVAFEDGCTQFSYEVDLQSMPALSVGNGDTPVLDWSGLTRDVHGNTFDSLNGSPELLVAWYDVGGPEEVEALFLQLDSAAAELYRLDVYSETEADLAELDGFGGFTKDGVWLVGIVDTTALSPVPLLLARVEVD